MYQFVLLLRSFLPWLVGFRVEPFFFFFRFLYCTRRGNPLGFIRLLVVFSVTYVIRSTDHYKNFIACVTIRRVKEINAFMNFFKQSWIC
jgi:hypothetical protein